MDKFSDIFLKVPIHIFKVVIVKIQIYLNLYNAYILIKI